MWNTVQGDGFRTANSSQRTIAVQHRRESKHLSFKDEQINRPVGVRLANEVVTERVRSTLWLFMSPFGTQDHVVTVQLSFRGFCVMPVN